MSLKGCKKEEIPARLRAAGISPTIQRLTIAEIVLSEGRHPNVKEVMQAVQDRLPMVSQATVYNTLNTLVEKGVLVVLRGVLDGSVRYDGNVEPHHHLVDSRSGKIIDIDLEDIQIANLEELKKKFRVNRVTVTIDGEPLNPI